MTHLPDPARNLDRVAWRDQGLRRCVIRKYLPSLDKVVWEKSQAIEEIPFDDQIALPAPLQLVIRRSRLSVEILKRPSTNETKYDLFQRLNAGGTEANAQELRNVIVIMVNPVYHQFMRDCARNQHFLTVLSASADQIEKQRDMEYVSRFLVNTYVQYDGKLDVEEFVDKGIVDLATAGEIPNARNAFDDTFDILNQAYGEDALRRFNNGQASGRVLLAAYECIAVGIAKNIAQIKAKPNPTQYVRQRIDEFWRDPRINQFFVPGLRGTVRIQRTIPFGAAWFAA